METESHPEVKPSGNHFKSATLFLSIGAGLAVMILLISWISYGRVYFFDGYTITAVGWIASFASTLYGATRAGLCLLQEYNKQFFLRAISLFATVVGVLVCSFIINGSKANSSYGLSPGYVQSAFEPCHSTYYHQQALNSYDLNNDNSISAAEMDLFLKAHPQAVNDQDFVDWIRRNTN
ncbi:MAG: hypothetical protein E7328_03620 [Clostridiales bacterium]|nr:hypothetical protein [Clostridiales bacterium]